MLHIGSLRYESPLFMAPMEGITDVPFRKIVREHGCGVTCTQMIHAEALLRGDPVRMRETACIDPSEHPVGMQLCGSESGLLNEAAKKAVDLGADFIDLNMGCPAKNVVKLGAGAALLKDPLRVEEIVRGITSSVSVPVTVKIRAGWDEHYKNALEIGRILQDSGASLVTVHARTKSQKHSGAADLGLVAQLKRELSIPVVGNGGVDRAHKIDEMFSLTHADGVMVARGALGNPWIFQKRRPSAREIRDTLLSHLDQHLSFHANTQRALLTFRKHIVWYTIGLANASDFRVRVFKETLLPAVLEMIHTFFDTFNPDQVIELQSPQGKS